MLFSSGKRRNREAAERLYGACVAAARRPELYRSYGVPDTLQGRFEMLALHLFPVLHRLMHEPGDDPELAMLVAEVFVTDMDGAFRDMGVGDLKVPKRITTMYRSFGGRIGAYKQALEGGRDELAAAVARNVFPDAEEDRRAHDLALYVSSAVQAVGGADLGRLKDGEAPFPPLGPRSAEDAP